MLIYRLRDSPNSAEAGLQGTWGGEYAEVSRDNDCGGAHSWGNIEFDSLVRLDVKIPNQRMFIKCSKRFCAY